MIKEKRKKDEEEQARKAALDSAWEWIAANVSKEIFKCFSLRNSFLTEHKIKQNNKTNWAEIG